jgi:hypothetical protein
VTAHITGLAPNAAFHVQLVAANAGGTSNSADSQTTTPPLPPTIGPRSATNIQPTSALLTARVDPNGGALSACRFVYGPSTSYGHSVPCTQKVGDGPVAVQVSAVASGLKPATHYHFTLVASNQGGQSSGADSTFRTPGPSSLRIVPTGTVKHAAATLTMRCAGARRTTCAGRITLILRVHNHSITIGQSAYRLVAPASKHLRIRLTALALRSLGTGQTLHVIVLVKPTIGAPSRQSIQLRA